jgi:hypothetical protein
MMVTAGHCVVNPDVLGEYQIAPNSPNNAVCCRFNAARECVAGLFSVRAWVTTKRFIPLAPMMGQSFGFSQPYKMLLAAQSLPSPLSCRK